MPKLSKKISYNKKELTKFFFLSFHLTSLNENTGRNEWMNGNERMWQLNWGMTSVFQSTAVGQYAIQLAKVSGFKVATTASKRRWETLKGFGADLIVDYKVGRFGYR